MMKRLILGLTAATMLALPAAADHYLRGTINSVSPDTVWINTAQGVVAVPTNSATFRSGNAFLRYRNLFPGRQVTVSTPVILDSRAQMWDDDNDNRWNNGRHRGWDNNRGRGHWHNGRWYRD